MNKQAHIIYSLYGYDRYKDMEKGPFDVYEIPSGRYCLVPEDKISDLLMAINVVNLLDISPKSSHTLAFLVKFYRFKADLSKSELAKKANLSRHTVRQIEEIEEHKFEKESIEAISKVFSKLFGRSFNDALAKIGIKI